MLLLDLVTILEQDLTAQGGPMIVSCHKPLCSTSHNVHLAHTSFCDIPEYNTNQVILILNLRCYICQLYWSPRQVGDHCLQ